MHTYAPVAQLDKAPPSEGGDCAFESRRVRHQFSLLRVKRTIQGIHMFRIIVILSVILPLAACNSVYVKPNSLDTSQKIYVPVGGYSMKRSIKVAMQNRGYNIRTGALIKTHDTADDSNDFDLETYQIPSGTKYSVRVRERSEIFRPIWCMFNGFWWWNFNVSIVEQKTGTEILSWRGRGCQNSSLRKLDELLETMEIKKADK